MFYQPLANLGVRGRKPRWRRARRQALRAQGIKETMRWRVWNVRPLLIVLPDWAKERAVPGIYALPGSVWLRPRDAHRLCAMDRRAGGCCDVLKTEYHRCQLCRRPLLADEAAQRRAFLETSPEARQQPCGPNCQKDREMRLYGGNE